MAREPQNVQTHTNFTAADFGSPAEWFDYRHKLGEAEVGKHFTRATLGLTGMEVSFGVLPPGVSLPFLHAHKQNEEIYIAIAGDGEMQIDGQRIPLTPGTTVRVAPAGMRVLRGGTQPLSYIVVQAKAGSLEQATREDGIMSRDPVTW